MLSILNTLLHEVVGLEPIKEMDAQENTMNSKHIKRNDVFEMSFHLLKCAAIACKLPGESF